MIGNKPQFQTNSDFIIFFLYDCWLGIIGANLGVSKFESSRDEFGKDSEAESRTKAKTHKSC